MSRRSHRIAPVRFGQESSDVLDLALVGVAVLCAIAGLLTQLWAVSVIGAVPSLVSDIVRGDRHGAAAGRAVVDRIAQAFEREGWRTARNRPYAGGHVIERQGRPAERRHAVQIELRRDLYLDEATLALAPGFDALRASLDHVIAALSTTDWAALA